MRSLAGITVVVSLLMCEPPLGSTVVGHGLMAHLPAARAAAAVAWEALSESTASAAHSMGNHVHLVLVSPQAARIGQHPMLVEQLPDVQP